MSPEEADAVRRALEQLQGAADAYDLLVSRKGLMPYYRNHAWNDLRQSLIAIQAELLSILPEEICADENEP